MNDLVVPGHSLLKYLANANAENTRQAYASDFRCFAKWCEVCGQVWLPAHPEVLAFYLRYLADGGLKMNTITRRACAIRFAHLAAGYDSPTNHPQIKKLLAGIKRTIGAAVNRKTPTTAQTIAAMLEQLSEDLRGKRDRALLLIGFAGALRRSELVALDVEDIERDEEGIRITIRRSKTDQEGAGQVIAIPHGARLMPVQALDAWLKAASIEAGPIFRGIRRDRVESGRLGPKQVERIVKAAAAAAGYDPKLFGGHSLRTGFVTSALESGADILKIMDVTRHRNIQTLKVYDRRVQAFRGHAGKDFL